MAFHDWRDDRGESSTSSCTQSSKKLQGCKAGTVLDGLSVQTAGMAQMGEPERLPLRKFSLWSFLRFGHPNLMPKPSQGELNIGFPDHTFRPLLGP